jgi:hypothetical protein
VMSSLRMLWRSSKSGERGRDVDGMYVSNDPGMGWVYGNDLSAFWIFMIGVRTWNVWYGMVRHGTQYGGIGHSRTGVCDDTTSL